MIEPESMFGRGFATCLWQFLCHRARLDETVTMYRETRIRHHELELFGDDHAVQLWANGASDHLYELERPVVGVSPEEWARAKDVASNALDIGHGRGLMGQRTAEPEEAHGLLDQALGCLAALEARHGVMIDSLDAAMAIDRDVLGLQPERGEFDCPVNLTRKEMARSDPGG